MFSIKYPLVFWSILLLPNVFFLVPVMQFCKKRNLPAAPWVSGSFLAPCLAIPSLWAREQREEMQQKTFWKFFIMALVLEIMFAALAYVTVMA
jgi:hypothetical protein